MTYLESQFGTSFTLENDVMIFSEREGHKLDSVHKYTIKCSEKEELLIYRDWMMTSQGKLDLLRNGKIFNCLILNLMKLF